MNFLAHLYLSNEFGQFMIGNFIADAVKGKELLSYNEQIQKGIVFHRKIDAFTDSHPDFLKSKILLRQEYGKFAGVIVDIFYDHFLALHWSDFSTYDLKYYSNNVYEFMKANYATLPPKIQYMLPRMIQYNWLYNYQYLEGIEKTLIGMASRTKFESNMEKSIDNLRSDYDAFQSNFFNFMPALIEYGQKIN